MNPPLQVRAVSLFARYMERNQKIFAQYHTDKAISLLLVDYTAIFILIEYACRGAHACALLTAGLYAVLHKPAIRCIF